MAATAIAISVAKLAINQRRCEAIHAYLIAQSSKEP
jgi:hypothetical protein